MRDKHRPSEKAGIFTPPAWVIIALAAIAYFAFIGAYSFLDPDEGRYAEIPREMRELGDWVTPHLNYLKYFEKPPVFYWLVGAMQTVFGEHEWISRTVPGAAAFCTLLMLLGFGKRYLNETARIVAAMVWLGSVLSIAHARLLIIDGVFATALTATWLCWYNGYRATTPKVRTGWYVAAWGLMGVAVMTKGPAAIILTGLIILGFIAWQRDWRALKQMAWLPGILTFVIIAVPWHVLMSIRNPEFVQFYLIDQNFGRFTGTEHTKPFYFFPPIYLVGFLPWFPLVIPCLWSAISFSFQKVKETTIKNPINDEIGLLRFCLVCLIAVLGFFSASNCKLIPYILPAVPFGCLIVGWHIAYSDLKSYSTRWWGLAGAILWVCLSAGAIFAAAEGDPVPAHVMMPVAYALGLALLLGGMLIASASFKPKWLPIACLLAMLITLPSLISVLSTVQRYRRIPELLTNLPDPLPKEIKIAEWGDYDQSFSYYTHRQTYLIDGVDELYFGKEHNTGPNIFFEGEAGVRKLATEGPLLLIVAKPDERWPSIKAMGLFKPVAANSLNLMVGNEAFFKLTGMAPWPEDFIGPGAYFLPGRMPGQPPVINP